MLIKFTMDTRTATATRIDAILPLMWLASPALPVGGFSYSEGLEAAVDAARVDSEETAADWLAQQLHLALARADLVVVKRVLARAADMEAMNAWMLQTRETSELRQQTVQMGRSLVEWLKVVRPGSVTPALARKDRDICYPVAWAACASTFDIDLRDALAAFAFGWAENMVQAAVRVVPLGQSAGQRILSRLAGEIAAVVDEALHRDEPQAFTPMLAILSSRHEHQYSRLFRS